MQSPPKPILVLTARHIQTTTFAYGMVGHLISNGRVRANWPTGAPRVLIKWRPIYLQSGVPSSTPLCKYPENEFNLHDGAPLSTPLCKRLVSSIRPFCKHTHKPHLTSQMIGFQMFVPAELSHLRSSAWPSEARCSGRAKRGAPSERSEA